MKNKINLILMLGTVLLAGLTLCGYRTYDTESNLWDRVIVAVLWIGVGLDYMSSYLKGDKK